MKTASLVGVILPPTPVHVAQILNSIFQWGVFNPGTFTFNPNSMKISNWTTNVAKQTNNDLDWPGLSRKHISRELRVFGVKFWTQNFVCVKKFTFCNSASELFCGKTLIREMFLGNAKRLYVANELARVECKINYVLYRNCKKQKDLEQTIQNISAIVLPIHICTVSRKLFSPLLAYHLSIKSFDVDWGQLKATWDWYGPMFAPPRRRTSIKISDNFTVCNERSKDNFCLYLVQSG